MVGRPAKRWQWLAGGYHGITRTQQHYWIIGMRVGTQGCKSEQRENDSWLKSEDCCSAGCIAQTFFKILDLIVKDVLRALNLLFALI